MDNRIHTPTCNGSCRAALTVLAVEALTVAALLTFILTHAW